MGDCVIPSHIFNRERFWQQVLRSLRDDFYETLFGRAYQFFLPQTPSVHSSPFEIISSYAPGSTKKCAPIPEGFLEGFDALPDVVIRIIAEKYRQFGSPLLNLRLVSPRFHETLKTCRRTVRRHAKISLNGFQKAYICKCPHNKVEVTHEQLSRNLNSASFLSLQIELLSGPLVATAFHIPDVVCKTLFISIIDSVESRHQLELLLEQTIRNEHIEAVYIRARRRKNHVQLQESLYEITRRAENRKKYHISISCDHF